MTLRSAVADLKREHELDLHRVKGLHRQEVEALKATHSHTQSVDTCTLMCVCVCMCMWMCVCVHVHAFMRVHIFVFSPTNCFKFIVILVSTISDPTTHFISIPF